MTFHKLYEIRDKLKDFLIRAEATSITLGFDNVVEYLRYTLNNPEMLYQFCKDPNEQDSELSNFIEQSMRNKMRMCRLDNFSDKRYRLFDINDLNIKINEKMR